MAGPETRGRTDDAEDAGHLDLARTRDLFDDSADFTIGLEEEFAIVDPETLDLRHRFEDMYAAFRTTCWRSRRRGS
jgi:hypothetical protein